MCKKLIFQKNIWGILKQNIPFKDSYLLISVKLLELKSECDSKAQDISFDDPPSSSSLKSVRRKNVHEIIFARLNINSLSSIFHSLQAQIKENVCILILLETKRGESFPEEQFKVPGFKTPFEGMELNFGVEL